MQKMIYRLAIVSIILVAVVGCARDAGLAALDLFPAFRGARDENPERYQRYFFGHMTPSGNRFVARQMAASIRGNGLLD